MAKLQREILPLPVNLTPSEYVCFQFRVPNDVQHFAAFWGAIDALAHRYNWGKPLTTDSAVIANYWRNLIEENRICFEGSMSMAGNGCGCCDDPIYRYNENGIKEVSHDGGATWEADLGDERISGTILPLPPWLLDPTADRACLGAESLISGVKASTNEILGSGVTTFASLVGTIVSVVCAATAGTVCGIAAIVGATASFILAVTAAAISAEMTTENYDILKCIFYCHIKDDASFDEAGWNAVKSDIVEQFGGNAEFWFWNMVNTLGSTGLTNMARIAVFGVPNCDDCACAPCDINSVYLHNFATDTWHLVEPESDTTVVLNSTSNGSREIIQFSFGAPNGEGDCCNVVAYEQTDGNAIYIVDYMDCTGENFTQALPTPGCRKMVTIYSQVEPEPPISYRITLGEDCLD